MFEHIPFPSLQVLHIATNILKGGDIMCIETVAGLRNTSFPESAGRTSIKATEKLPPVALAASRIPGALEIATIVDLELREAIETMDWESGMQVARTGCKIRTAEEIATTVDRVTLASVGSMDGRE